MDEHMDRFFFDATGKKDLFGGSAGDVATKNAWM